MNWNDITFKQYIDIDTIVKDTELTEEERCFALVQAVYGINLLSQPLTEYKKYVNSLNFLKEKMPEMTLNDTYEVNGTVYEFRRNVKDLTVGAFMDYQNYSKGEKNLDTYANILTIFLIPKGCKYNEGYDIVKARRDMLDLPAPVALSMAAFFLSYWKNYVKVFLRYSMWKIWRTKGIPKDQKKEIMASMREMIKNPPMAGAYSL